MPRVRLYLARTWIRMPTYLRWQLLPLPLLIPFRKPSTPSSFKARRRYNRSSCRPTLPRKTAPVWLLVFKLLERTAKGFTWVGSVLLLVGIAANWRTFLRPEHLALLAMNFLLLVVSGIRYRSAGLDLRYFMPMVIVGLPWMV